MDNSLKGRLVAFSTALDIPMIIQVFAKLESLPTLLLYVNMMVMKPSKVHVSSGSYSGGPRLIMRNQSYRRRFVDIIAVSLLPAT